MNRQELEKALTRIRHDDPDNRTDLPPNDFDAICGACNAAIQAYLDDRGATEARRWRQVRKLAVGKGRRSISGMIQEIAQTTRTLSPQDPEILEIQPRLQRIEQELGQLAASADRRLRYYGPVNERGQLYVQVMRSWVNAGGSLGASPYGPLQRLLCFVAEQVNQQLRQLEAKGASIPETKFLELTPLGARDVIRREQKRQLRAHLAGENNLGAEAYLIDESGNRKDLDF
jgi:hypothetical protein